MVDKKLKRSLLKLPPIEKFAVKRAIKKSNLKIKKSDIKIGSSEIKELERFVKETMEKGYSEERVRVALMSVGWTQEQVDKAFKKVKK